MALVKPLGRGQNWHKLENRAITQGRLREGWEHVGRQGIWQDSQTNAEWLKEDSVKQVSIPVKGKASLFRRHNNYNRLS